jgi:hypothetical protein
MQYYYMDSADVVAGPIPKEGLIELLRAKEITKTTQICAAGSEDWVPITDVVKPKPKGKKKVRRTQTSTSMPTATEQPGDVQEPVSVTESSQPKAKAKAKQVVAEAAPISETDADAPQEVVVLNLKMPFGSMIWFMLKWAFAAIPAMIILFAAFIGLCIGASKLAPGKFKCPVKLYAPETEPKAKKEEEKAPDPKKKSEDSKAGTDEAATTDPTGTGDLDIPDFKDESDPGLAEDPVLPDDVIKTDPTPTGEDEKTPEE